MNYKDLQTSLYKNVIGSSVKTQTSCYDHVITESDDGAIFIDNVPTLFENVEQARLYIKESKVQDQVQKEIQQDLYSEISDNKIMNIIREHHTDVKVTDTLIESYVELATSKVFNTDPVSYSIRKINKLDTLVENKLDFKLNDGTSIVISEDLYQRINNIFGHHEDVIKYMRESADHFLNVVDQIEE